MKMQRTVCVMAGLAALSTFGCSAAPEASEPVVKNESALTTYYYEAENPFDLEEGTVVDGSKTCKGYTGAGYIQMDQAVNMIAWYTITLPETSKSITVRYSNPTKSALPTHIASDGVVVATLKGNTTKNCSTWTTETLNVKISAGSHDLTFVSTKSGGMPLLDNFSIAMP